MKGVVLSTSFFILSIATFLSLGWYVNYDHNRSLINNNFKKSIIQTGYLLKDNEDIDEDLVLDTLLTEINQSLPNNFDYQFELLGFNADPILIRVKLKCKSKNNFYNFALEETLIEKEQEDAKE